MEGFSTRRSSCLLFQMFGVETRSFLPYAAHGIGKSMPTPRLCLLLSGNSGWQGLGLLPESA
jgi:hypothetical protein